MLHVHPLLRLKICELDGSIRVTDDGNDNLIMEPREPLPVVAMSSAAARRMIYYPSEIEWGAITEDLQNVVDPLDIFRTRVAMSIACAPDAHPAARQFLEMTRRLTDQRIHELSTPKPGDTTTLSHVTAMFHQNAHRFMQTLSIMSRMSELGGLLPETETFNHYRNPAGQRPWELDVTEYIHPITGEVLGLRDPSHFTAPMRHCFHLFSSGLIDHHAIPDDDAELTVDFENVE